MYIDHLPGKIIVHSGPSPAEESKRIIIFVMSWLLLAIFLGLVLWFVTGGDLSKAPNILNSIDKWVFLLPLFIFIVNIAVLLRPTETWTFNNDTKTFTWSHNSIFKNEESSYPFDQITYVRVDTEIAFQRRIELTAKNRTLEIIEGITQSIYGGINSPKFDLVNKRFDDAAVEINRMLTNKQIQS